MLKRLLTDLGITSVLCLAERVIERFMFPGLHRTAGRVVVTDPSRVDDLATLVAEALGLLAVIWLFNGSLYAIGWLTHRPLKPQVPTLVAAVILVLTFAGAYAQWAVTPTPMPK